MAGGPNSFGSGHWNETSIGKMLPVQLIPAARDWDLAQTTVHPVTEGAIHPIWHLTSDEAQNRSLLTTLPNFQGNNHVGRAKPVAEVLARTTSPGADGELMPAVVVQNYGRGRAMAMTTAITRRWAGRVHSIVGRGRCAVLQKVLAQRHLLADRELVDRPPPTAGRDRQAALPAWRADRPPRPDVRRERRTDARLPRRRDRRAEIGGRRHLGQLAAPPPRRHAAAAPEPKRLSSHGARNLS